MPSTSTPSAHNKTLIIITIMLVAILEVLDSTIVNVALPNMMPSLDANQDQITWVLTSYVVAAAMMLPLTGFLSERLGIKNLLLLDIVGFLISSILCGTATTLDLMVFYRLLQGGFGAALIPLSQAILRATFPLNEQGKAMAIWGLGIMAAPVLGPTLGGLILAHASWRWIFYLNGPVCLLGLVMTMAIIPKSPARNRKIDYLSVLLMFCGIGFLQIFLDQGNSDGWFRSNMILLFFIISIFSLIVFIIRSVTCKNAVISLGIFKNRNFTLCTILLALYCGCLFGFVTLQPIMLENLFNYTPLLAGETMVGLGLSAAVGMSLCSFLMSRFSVKTILTASLLIAATGAYYFSTLSLNAAINNFLLGNALFGLGLGLFMVPLTTYSLATMPAKNVTEAAGLFTYGRMLGTSMGVSLLSTLVARESQINWMQLNEHLTVFSNNLHQWLQQQHFTIHNTNALNELQMTLSSQSSMLAFLDAYRLMAILLLLFIPILFAMESVELSTKPVTTDIQ